MCGLEVGINVMQNLLWSGPWDIGLNGRNIRHVQKINIVFVMDI